jgi:alanine-glyoxylate transaminase / (R)-3-amino-2-methylpropionate-pyruvate transaminase
MEVSRFLKRVFFNTQVPHGHHVQRATCPDLFKGPWRYGDEDAIQKYVDQVKDAVLYSTSGKVAGFIAETIQGVGGTIESPDGYLPQVYDVVRKAGLVI